jgi:hypothetical protein
MASTTHTLLISVPSVSQEDPGRTVQTFIDLVQRHEQSFYTFVHNVHSKGQGLFDSLMSWIELFLSYARDGLPQPIDLDFILPHSGPERIAIMAEVDAVAQYHYRLKISHEEKIRRRFDKSVDKKGEEEEAALLDSVMASLSIGEGVVGEAGEIEDVEEDEDEGDEDGESDEERYDGGVGDASRRSSINTSQPPQVPAKDQSVNRTSNPLISLSTPDHSDSNLPFLNPENESREGSRRSSHSHGRSSIDRIRSSLDFKRDSNKDKDREGKEGKKEKANPPPPIRLSREKESGGGSGMSTPKRSAARRAKKRAAMDLLVPPETKAIEELRPLFVEMVSSLQSPFSLAPLVIYGFRVLGIPDWEDRV